MSLYDTLGVDKNVDDKTLTRAFHTLSKKYHPDRLDRDDPEYEEKKQKFIEIKYAYSVLSNPDEKEEYDRKNTVNDNDTLFDPNKVIDDMLQNNESDVPDVWVPIQCNVMDAYKGKDIDIDYSRISECEKCNGNGTHDGIEHICMKCEGRGAILDTIIIDDRPMYKESECLSCEGKGIDPSVTLCVGCKGNKYYSENKKCTVSMPKGVYKNYIITLKGKGNYIPHNLRTNDETRTDVKVIIEDIDYYIIYDMISKRKRRKHKKNGVRESDITIPQYSGGVYINGVPRYCPSDILCDLTIEFAESISGIAYKLLHVNGDIIELKIDDVIQNGDQYIIENHGLPLIKNDDNNKNTGDSTHGNIVIRFTVKRPELDRKQRNRLWQIITNTSYHKKLKLRDNVECVDINTYIHEFGRDDNKHEYSDYDEYDEYDDYDKYGGYDDYSY